MVDPVVIIMLYANISLTVALLKRVRSVLLALSAENRKGGANKARWQLVEISNMQLLITCNQHEMVNSLTGIDDLLGMYNEASHRGPYFAFLVTQ